MSPLAMAASFELDNGVTVDIDTTLGYDAQWRMESQNSTVLSGGGNPVLALLGDDGNRNFDKHDMTQNRLSFGTDVDINYGAGGVFLRARGWYDDAYNDLDLAPAKSFQQDGIDLHASDVELLDAFIYHGFSVGDRYVSLRVGEQVVNWGESLFIGGGISSAQGPLDASKANAPGVELKDIFMPIGQVLVEASLTDNLSLGAYYQYDWQETRIDAPGSYFSVLDGLGQESVGDTLDIGTPVMEDTPDKGQAGLALRYLAENLNSTEFGLYYLRYNDFMPALQLNAGTGFADVHEYFEDIDLVGLSFGTVIGDTNVSGEISYRDGQPVQLNVPGQFVFERAKTVQAQVSAIHVFPENPFADQLVFTGEIGYNRVLDIDGVSGSVSDALDNDRSAASFTGRLTGDYYNVLPSVNLKASATYRNDFNGVSSVPFTFTEGGEVFSLKADFTSGPHAFGGSYVWYLTDVDDILGDTGKLELSHLNADRDYAALYYKFRF
ncbi:DUF1302 domain-containing protein [Marinobacterium maritimum]|uniref:DUF1302 domain-containing protein n=2 Tax=Marinobacterium maritimum TaxID=500162 RepID=A0ABN1I2V7_9GAMM